MWCNGVSAAEGERTIAPGGVIVRFLSRFKVLETSSAIDRPGGVIVRTTENVATAAGLQNCERSHTGCDRS
jgi:hypothetical protein